MCVCVCVCVIKMLNHTQRDIQGALTRFVKMNSNCVLSCLVMR